MKNLLTLVLMLAASACSSLTTAPSVPPAVTEPAKPEFPSVKLEEIQAYAANSACAGHTFWKYQGKMPKGYVKGVALTYAKAFCRQGDGDVDVVARPLDMQKSEAERDVYDALSWYASNFRAAGLKNDTPEERLRHTYTMLLALGMPESTGQYCCGRDASANFSTADSAEAGAWQGSWGARRVSPELAKLLNKYRNSDKGCFLDVFKEGVKPSYCEGWNARTWGEGDGAVYQKLAKSCPAFAAEYTAILVRLLGGTKGEFGPLRKKNVELVPACASMFHGIQKMIEANPGTCEEFKK